MCVMNALGVEHWELCERVLFCCVLSIEQHYSKTSCVCVCVCVCACACARVCVRACFIYIYIYIVPCGPTIQRFEPNTVCFMHLCTIVDAAREVIQTQGKSPRNEWWDEECRKVIQEKNAAREKCLQLKLEYIH